MQIELSSIFPSSDVELLILGLASWRIANLLARESGPWAIFHHLRLLVGVRYENGHLADDMGMIANGITCIFCNSVWVGAALVGLRLALPLVAEVFAFVMALSMISILVDRLYL